jgi:hypothetical protein
MFQSNAPEFRDMRKPKHQKRIFAVFRFEKLHFSEMLVLARINLQAPEEMPSLVCIACSVSICDRNRDIIFGKSSCSRKLWQKQAGKKINVLRRHSRKTAEQ